MKTIEEKIEIYRAFLEGEQIEFTIIGVNHWQNEAVIPEFNWEDYDYRVKPKQPKKNVAYAFVSKFGLLTWRLNDKCVYGFERSPEFDIIARDPNE